MKPNPLKQPKQATKDLLCIVSAHALTTKSLNEQMHNGNAPIEIAILIDDQELIRLVATWPKLNDDERKSLSVIAEIANIPRSRIESALRRAKTHKLIYDDGTINPIAEKVIMSIVGQKLAETMEKITKAASTINESKKPAKKNRKPHKRKAGG